MSNASDIITNKENIDLSILKTILNDKKYAIEFAHDCNEKIFDQDYWRFSKYIVDYIKIYKEAPTKRVMLDRIGKNETFAKYVSDVWDKIETHIYDLKDYKHDLEKLKNRYAKSLIIGLKNNLSSSDGLDVKKSYGELQSVINNIKNINQIKTYEQKTLKDSVSDFKQKYTAKMNNPDLGVGVLTHFSFLDSALNGIRDSEFLVVAGGTGSGKSMMLMNMAINMWLQKNDTYMERDFQKGYDILYFSLEMPYEDMLERVLSRLAGIPQKSIRDATLTKEEGQKLGRALKFIENYPHNFEIVDIPRGASIETVELIFNDICAVRQKPKVIVVDYLTLMEYDGELDDWLKAGKIAEQLSEFARATNTVMLSAVQLNDPKMEGKAPEEQIGLHRIARSRQIAHNCNLVIQILKRKQEELFPDMELHMIKSRRSNLSHGKVYKNLANCTLSDIKIDENISPDDISKDIENINL